MALKRTSLAILLLGMCISGGQANAANFSFTGSFTQDDNVQLFNFSVGATSNVVLRSLSYAGGVNSQNVTIARGGFDPILALFDATGALINQNDDGAPGTVPVDTVTGLAYDTYLALNGLAAGNYTVAVMQYNNFANGPNLSNGFSRDGQGNFTGATYGCSQGSFCDFRGNNRNVNWAFDIEGVESATLPDIPVPAALPLFATGLAAVGYAGRRRKATVAR
ncbi:MAG: DVUA0089 family protein [Hyphomicrobiales bacterium]